MGSFVQKTVGAWPACGEAVRGGGIGGVWADAGTMTGASTGVGGTDDRGVGGTGDGDARGAV